MILVNTFVCQLLISLFAIPLDLIGVLSNGSYLGSIVCPFLAFVHTMFGKIISLRKNRSYFIYHKCQFGINWSHFCKFLRFVLFLWTRCFSCHAILFGKKTQSVSISTKKNNISSLALCKDYLGIRISCFRQPIDWKKYICNRSSNDKVRDLIATDWFRTHSLNFDRYCKLF